jgi:hypothetical protein
MQVNKIRDCYDEESLYFNYNKKRERERERERLESTRSNLAHFHLITPDLKSTTTTTQQHTHMSPTYIEPVNNNLGPDSSRPNPVLIIFLGNLLERKERSFMRSATNSPDYLYSGPK